MRPLKRGSGRGRMLDGSAVFWPRPCFVCVLCFVAFVLRFFVAMPSLLPLTASPSGPSLGVKSTLRRAKPSASALGPFSEIRERPLNWSPTGNNGSIRVLRSFDQLTFAQPFAPAGVTKLRVPALRFGLRVRDL